MGQRLVHGHGVVIFVNFVEVPRVRRFRVLEEIKSQTPLLLPATGRVDLQGLEEGGHAGLFNLDRHHDADRRGAHLGKGSSLDGERGEGSGAGEQRAGPHQVLEEHRGLRCCASCDASNGVGF